MGLLTKREKEVLDLLKRDPMISQEDLAARLQITRSATAVHISNLIKKGAILGRGYVISEPAGVVLAGGLRVEILLEGAKRGEGEARIKVQWGGSVYRLATSLARLEVGVTVLSALGQDRLGREILKDLQREGVGTGHLLLNSHLDTAKLVREKASWDYLWVDKGTSELLDAVYFTSREGVILRSRVLLAEASLQAASLEVLASVSARAGNCFCLLVQEGNDVSVLPRDALVLADYGPIGEDAPEACRRLLAKGAGTAIVNGGSHGIAMAGREGEVLLRKAPGQEAEWYDFLAGLLYGLTRGYELRQSIRIGMASPLKDLPA